MKAVVYKGPRDVVVKNVPDAKIEKRKHKWTDATC